MTKEMNSLVSGKSQEEGGFAPSQQIQGVDISLTTTPNGAIISQLYQFSSTQRKVQDSEPKVYGFIAKGLPVLM